MWEIYASQLMDGDVVELPDALGKNRKVKLTNVHFGGHFTYFWTKEAGTGRLPIGQKITLISEEKATK
jgi:hypothetical protein